jgi:hypothetical protein
MRSSNHIIVNLFNFSRRLTVSSYPTISFSVDQRATTSIAISPFIESSIQLFFRYSEIWSFILRLNFLLFLNNLIFYSDTTLYACTLTCSITQATNSAIQLSQSSTTAAKGSYQTSVGIVLDNLYIFIIQCYFHGFIRIYKINYKLTSSLVQLSSTFTIVCTAQSNGVTGVDQQYQSSIATGRIQLFLKYLSNSVFLYYYLFYKQRPY